jgi:transcriptional regulator with XRE-family HTH domain
MTNDSLSDPPKAAPISVNGVVAQNIHIARNVLGWAQQRLAQEAGVSRATIAQLEAGIGDPRLSTIELLAVALHVSPAFLTLDQPGFRALSEIVSGTAVLKAGNGQAHRRAMEALGHALKSGHYRGRLEAARMGVDAANQAGLKGTACIVGAALGSARLASRGTFLGAHLAHLIERYSISSPESNSRTTPDQAQFADGI